MAYTMYNSSVGQRTHTKETTMKTLKTRMAKWAGLVGCSLKGTVDPELSVLGHMAHLVSIPVLAPVALVVILIRG
jgi:hypothetical protein